MKKINYPIYSLAIALFLLLNFNLSSAQIINTESFEAATYPPAGWTMNAAVGGLGQFTNAIWVRRNVGSFPNSAAAHTGTWMSRYSSHFCADPSTQSLITPVIDYSGLTANDTAYVSLWVYRDNTSALGDSLTAFVNTIADLAGATRLGAVAQSIDIMLPDTFSVIGWYQYTFQIPQTFNTSTNFILFQGTGHIGNNIFTDDIEWTSYPQQCAGVPTIGIMNANPTLICGGTGTTTMTLTGQSVGASGLSIVWQSSSSAIGPWTDVANDISVYTSDTLDTNTYFRCYISCSNSLSADTAVAVLIEVSISPLPVLTVAPNGTTAYCNGSDPVILSVSGATDYIWSPAAGLDVTTGDVVFASPLVNTTYTVIGSDISGCAASDILIINVANGPVVNPSANDDTTCTGSPVQMNSGGGGFGNQYEWNPGAIVGNNVTVTPTVTTTYTLSATNNAGCITIDSSLVIVVTQDVNADFGYTMIGNTVVFHDSSFNASSWSWNFGDGNSSANQNPIYTYSGSGAYTVTLIVTSAGCPGGDTVQIQLVLFPSSIENVLNENAISIFPNPVATDLLNLNFIMKDAISQLTIVNSLGQIVWNSTLTAPKNSSMNESIHIGELNSGIYEVNLKSVESHRNVRFVKL